MHSPSTATRPFFYRSPTGKGYLVAVPLSFRVEKGKAILVERTQGPAVPVTIEEKIESPFGISLYSFSRYKKSTKIKETFSTFPSEGLQKGSPTFSGILWDLDGTLLNTGPKILKHAKDTLSEFGVDLRQVSLQFPLEKSTKERFAELLPHPADSEAAVARFWQRYADDSTPADLCPYALSTVESLFRHGIRMGVVTNKRGDLARQEIVQYPGLARSLEFCLGTGEGFPRKPHPDMIFEGVRRLGIPMERVALVGDSLADYLAAKSAGVHSIIVGRALPNLDPKTYSHHSRLVHAWREILPTEKQKIGGENSR